MQLRKNLVAAGAAVGMTLAGLGVAAAQTDDSTPTAPPAAEAPDGAQDQGGRGGPGGPGGRHGGKGKGMGIHGEFVTANPAGGWQTIATQRGEVTAVNAESVKVKSEDGFERTYAVNDDTLVSSANNGIADVAVGDAVHVTAVVAGDTATAKTIREKPARPAN